MSEQPDDSQKTEEPTSKRLRDARSKGQVAVSREINTWVLLFGTGLMIALVFPTLMVDMTRIFMSFLERPHDLLTDRGGLGAVTTELVVAIATILAIPMGVFVILALISGVSQTGFNFATKPIEPELSKISPMKGLQRLFSMKQFVEFIKGILKIVLVAIVGIVLLMPELDRLDTLPTMPVSELLIEIQALVLRIFIGILAVLFVIAILDVIFQRMQHIKQLRMTKQEVKEEYKNTEGDPQVKGRLRQIRMQRARERMMQAVPTADVVVTNPTHFAVALAYKPETMEAPILVAKGQDLVAQRIRTIAEENDVAIVENPPLARALYATVEIDQEVPPEHYEAVAKVISYVFGLSGKRMPG
ncbi:MAG: flagellar biosynthesis protein FlhB [Alphaproteobacteria bacterium]|jgi:flagellar biosynthetic protein FlhB|uniref:flagellar biosynthesis protein FlhB n=1 Tax=Pacificispira sp. TaxID=2888761 RepID=UPI001B11E2B2|nr:flagellar biosynthesis protein FlhB [Alphaproteobacteria bacterium]MBO6861851.1 flagellar biosynthesis protein FlhB [Alphaproteobacteria bacterium]